MGINLNARRSFLGVMMEQEINVSQKIICVTAIGTAQEVKTKTGDFAVSFNSYRNISLSKAMLS